MAACLALPNTCHPAYTTAWQQQQAEPKMHQHKRPTGRMPPRHDSTEPHKAGDKPAAAAEPCLQEIHGNTQHMTHAPRALRMHDWSASMPHCTHHILQAPGSSMQLAYAGCTHHSCARARDKALRRSGRHPGGWMVEAAVENLQACSPCHFWQAGCGLNQQ